MTEAKTRNESVNYSRLPHHAIHRCLKTLFQQIAIQNIKLEWLAVKVGISRSCFGNWRGNHREPTIAMIEATLNALGYGIIALPLAEIERLEHAQASPAAIPLPSADVLHLPTYAGKGDAGN